MGDIRITNGVVGSNRLVRFPASWINYSFAVFKPVKCFFFFSLKEECKKEI